MDHTEQLQTLAQHFSTYEPALRVLAPALGATVSLYVLKFQQRGGITDADIARVHTYLKDVTVHGDDLFYRSEKWGETAKQLDQVAEIIAVLSFSPGGITIFGLHFEARTLSSHMQQAPENGYAGEEEDAN